jgi:acetate kinase
VGEYRPETRAAICRDLDELGIVLDAETNRTAQGEAKLSAAKSRVQIWRVPTNEELIVARQAEQLLKG